MQIDDLSAFFFLAGRPLPHCRMYANVLAHNEVALQCADGSETVASLSAHWVIHSSLSSAGFRAFFHGLGIIRLLELVRSSPEVAHLHTEGHERIMIQT